MLHFHEDELFSLFTQVLYLCIVLFSLHLKLLCRFRCTNSKISDHIELGDQLFSKKVGNAGPLLVSRNRILLHCGKGIHYVIHQCQQQMTQWSQTNHNGTFHLCVHFHQRCPVASWMGLRQTSENVWNLPRLCHPSLSAASSPARMTASSPTGPSFHPARLTVLGSEPGREHW